MPSWQEIARRNLRDAKIANGQKEGVRTSLSRSYYAAFSAIAAFLQGAPQAFPSGWQTPRHKDVQRLVSTYGDPSWRTEVRISMATLYRLRLDADYNNQVSLTSGDADKAAKLSQRVLYLVGSL